MPSDMEAVMILVDLIHHPMRIPANVNGRSGERERFAHRSNAGGVFVA
jgi:hypothetical protein